MSPDATTKTPINKISVRTKLCAPCKRVRDERVYRLRPTHLVHPEHGKPGVRDVRGHAICPECLTLWRLQ
jgi:hypothetical protein